MEKFTVYQLTPELFSRFGQIVKTPTKLPDISNHVLDFWSKIALVPDAGDLEIGLCKVKDRPWKLKEMENHLETPEIIIPLDGDMILPVAQFFYREPKPKAAETVLFKISPGICLILSIGTWHCLPFPINKATAEFLVIFQKGTAYNDLIIESLDKEIAF